MRRSISKTNPMLDTPRFAFGYELIPEHSRVLDFGCRDGEFGTGLVKNRSAEYVGLDKDVDAIRRARPGITVMEFAYPLPFPDEHFDVVTMFEVMEHLHDQDRILQQVRRVLRPAGLLIVSAPRFHLFSFLDLANFKFVFPTLHRLYYSFTKSNAEYRDRYVANASGLVGDIEKEKGWHQHFREREMQALLERNGFTVEEIDGAGLFDQVFTFLSHVLRLGALFPHRLRLWDSYTFHYGSVLFSARKQT